MQVGIDILEVDRFRDYDKEKLMRIFTVREIDYIGVRSNSLESTAGLFCAKEAFFKAIGTGLQISRMKEVEVVHNMQGAPHYKLSSKLVMEHKLSTAKISLNISHTKSIAVAVCVILKLDTLLG